MRILLTLFITALASTASCVSAQAVGKPCGSFDTCDAGLICKEESTFKKTCATAPAIGEACTYNGPNDKPGTTCASDGWCKRPEYWKASSLTKAAGVCAVLPNLGEKCDGQLWVPCKATKKSAISGIWTSTMYCDTYTMSAQDAICKTKKADGETCVNSFECENFCKDKKCAPGEITINTPSPTTDAPVVTQSPSVTSSPIVTQAPSVTQSPSVTQAPTGTGTGGLTGILGGSTGNTATVTGSLHTGMLMMTILFAACITLLF